MDTYARKTSIFSCIQYTGDNRDKIISALGVPKENCNCWINSQTNENFLCIKGIVEANLETVVKPKWWVIVGPDKAVGVLPDDMFKGIYQQVWIK